MVSITSVSRSVGVPPSCETSRSFPGGFWTCNSPMARIAAVIASGVVWPRLARSRIRHDR